MSARITASVFTSHVPAIGAALDQGKTDEPYWQPLFAGYEPSKEWMRDNTPDAIVLDLIMPGMPGVEVLRTLRDRNYSGGVIIMTGSHNEELLGEAWSLGPQEILIKPVDLERLLTAIQLVLVCREC